VQKLQSKPWKSAATAHLSWAAVPGAVNYVVELNATPQNPAGPWAQVGMPSPRLTRVITAPAAGMQVLARVAAVDSSEKLSDWSDVILVTTKT
jgi:hypothetical protein